MSVTFCNLVSVLFCSYRSLFRHKDYLRGEVMTDMFKYNNPALVTEQNAVMRYVGTSDAIMPNDTVPALDGITQDLNTSLLVPAIPITPPPATRTE